MLALAPNLPSPADAFVLESRAWAAELYQLLRSVDPARWRDAKAAELRAVGEALSERAQTLLKSAEGRAHPLRERVAELAALLESQTPGTHASSAQVRAAWASFRASAVPAYESLAAALCAEAAPVPSLRPSNLSRSAFHALTGLGALLLMELVFSERGRVWATGAFFALAWTLETTRRLYKPWNDLLFRTFSRVAHPHERFRINSSTWYGTALALLAQVCSLETGAVAVAVLGLADPAAALVGRRWGRHPLRGGRSLEGTLTFVITGALAAGATLGVFHASLGAATIVAMSLSAAVAGALAELLLTRVDDNFSIPIAAASAAGASAWLVAGL